MRKDLCDSGVVRPLVEGLRGATNDVEMVHFSDALGNLARGGGEHARSVVEAGATEALLDAAQVQLLDTGPPAALSALAQLVAWVDECSYRVSVPVYMTTQNH